jgi:predicted CXXCH cytochrome family protein
MKPELPIQEQPARRARWRRPKAIFFGAVIGATLLVSCVTVRRVVMVPPNIPGATFVGSENCSQCHDNITKGFHTATHSKLMAKGANASEVGCESCHGPGSLHSESGGAAGTIINPRQSAETCFQCHLDKRGEFHLATHHPVLEGKMSCGDCHDPHKGPAVKGGGTALISENETCFKCHTAQRGPFVFEHEASREGCLTCHKPHGSVNPRMLTERNQTLCLKCHFQQQTASGKLLIGGRDHTPLVSRGTCWTAGCHEAVHGSHVNSSLRF